MVNILRTAWLDDRGQDVAEYAVMLAVILVIVVGTLTRRLKRQQRVLLCCKLDPVRCATKGGASHLARIFARSPCVIVSLIYRITHLEFWIEPFAELARYPDGGSILFGSPNRIGDSGTE